MRVPPSHQIRKSRTMRHKSADCKRMRLWNRLEFGIQWRMLAALCSISVFLHHRHWRVLIDRRVFKTAKYPRPPKHVPLKLYYSLYILYQKFNHIPFLQPVSLHYQLSVLLIASTPSGLMRIVIAVYKPSLGNHRSCFVMHGSDGRICWIWHLLGLGLGGWPCKSSEISKCRNY